MLQNTFDRERGSVTAEFALILPVILAVIAILTGGIILASNRVALVSLSAELARYEARGDADAAAKQRARIPAHTRVDRYDEGSLHCVRLQHHMSEGPLAFLHVDAESCAVKSGVGTT